MTSYLSTDETRMLAFNAERLRLARGWSQEHLARVAGMHPSTLRKLRRSQHSARDKTLRGIALAFDVRNPGDLLRPYDPALLPTPPPVEAKPAPPSPAQAAFNQQVAELMRTAARVQQEDPDEGTRIYIQLTGRVRQMTQAVQSERRGDKWLRERRAAE